MDNIAMEMLSLVGINIRDLDVAKYAEAIKQTEDAKNQ
jgi:hypothetical protein